MDIGRKIFAVRILVAHPCFRKCFRLLQDFFGRQRLLVCRIMHRSFALPYEELLVLHKIRGSVSDDILKSYLPSHNRFQPSSFCISFLPHDQAAETTTAPLSHPVIVTGVTLLRNENTVADNAQISQLFVFKRHTVTALFFFSTTRTSRNQKVHFLKSVMNPLSILNEMALVKKSLLFLHRFNS